MQTLTHTRKELKNTLNRTGSVSQPPPQDAGRHLADGSGSEGPRASILEQGSSVGPGGAGGSVLSPQRKSAETGPRPQAGRLHSHSHWQRVGQAGSFPLRPLKAGPGRLWASALGGVGTEVPPGWPGAVGSSALGSFARRSVPGLVQTPLQSVVLVRVGEDLVAHPSKQVGRGLRGQDEGLHHGWGQLADHAPHRACQPLLLVAPRGHLADGLSRVQDALRRAEVSAGSGSGEGRRRTWDRQGGPPHLANRVVGLGHALPQVGRLLALTQPPHGALVLQGAGDGRRRGQDVIHRLRCGLGEHGGHRVRRGAPGRQGRPLGPSPEPPCPCPAHSHTSLCGCSCPGTPHPGRGLRAS